MHRLLLIALASSLALAGGAQAHHSRALFDLAHPVKLTGTVRQFQWTNPHCYIQLSVPGQTGGEEEWSVEMGAPVHLMGRGWTKKTLKPGDTISVVVAPLRSGEPGGELVSATRADGTPLGLQS